ncbi:MAG: response regulator [Candidatus Thermoplasmatota archaeon]|nr:response regulator [Candidatus Thermoplasmatota archaeon]MDD5777894.1 response regulator [Candidatus Thermoplasmatota archaeon]
MPDNPKIVLVIDDEETMQDLIQRNLARIDLPIRVHSALSGEEGVEKYRHLMHKNLRPDLVIMDLNLTQWGPGEIDGVETTRRILSLDPKANIYGYTAWFATRWSKELQEAGAKKVIERTTLPSDFRRLIEDILSP